MNQPAIGPYPPRMIMILHPKQDLPAFLDWVADGGWCRGVQARGDSKPNEMALLHEKGLEIMLEVLAHPRTVARQGTSRRFLTSNPADLTEPMRQAIGTDALFWQPFTEEDSSGVGFPHDLLQAKPKTHSQALHGIETRIAELLAVADKVPNIRLVATAGFGMTAHALARAPFEEIYLERTNDDVDDLQTGIAFCRGAARQYRKKWGIDLSLWWGPIFSTVGELPASYHRRAMYISYLAGADALLPEGIGADRSQMPDRIPPVAQAMEEVGRFMTRHEAGEPVTPVAVMLPKDHGWMSPPYWQPTRTRWNYARIPYRPGDRGMDGLFAHAFPGALYSMDPFPFGAYQCDDPKASPFSMACITPEYAPSAEHSFNSAPPIPFGRFHNRRAAEAELLEQDIDPSPYRPMGTSRWGDILDILTDDAEIETLQRYPAIILLGPIPAEHQAKLKRYVEAGGTLVVSAGTIGPDDAALTGLRLQPELRVGRAWRRSADGEDAAWVHEAFRYIHSAPVEGCSIQPRCVEASGAVLTARHQLGRGVVWTCLIPWFEGAASDLAGPAHDLLDTIIQPMQPWRVAGLPIQWLATQGEDHRTILLANHEDRPWTGRVTCRDDAFVGAGCTELITGQTVPVKHDGIDVTVSPFGVSILRLTRA